MKLNNQDINGIVAAFGIISFGFSFSRRMILIALRSEIIHWQWYNENSSSEYDLIGNISKSPRQKWYIYILFGKKMVLVLGLVQKLS